MNDQLAAGVAQGNGRGAAGAVPRHRIYEVARCCGMRFVRWKVEGRDWGSCIETCGCGKRLDYVRCVPGKPFKGEDLVDRSVSVAGADKKARIDLGLELLEFHALPRASFTYGEIAAWCGCSREAVRRIERKALRKIRKRLVQLGLWADLMRARAAA